MTSHHSQRTAAGLVLSIMLLGMPAYATDRLSGNLGGGYVRGLGWGGEAGLNLGPREFSGTHFRTSLFAGKDGAKVAIGVTRLGIGPAGGAVEPGLGAGLGTFGIALALSRGWKHNSSGGATVFAGPEIEYSLSYFAKVGVGARFPIGQRDGRGPEATFGITVGLPLF